MNKGSVIGVFALSMVAGVAGAHAEDNSFREKPWKFNPATGRDPFAFVPKVDVAQVRLVPPEKKEQIAPSTYYAEASRAFMEQNREDKLSETLAKCDAGLKALAEDPNAAADPLAQDLRERLIDLRKAALRVTERKEVERKFKTIPLRLTGIVRRDRGSQAIVNSRLARKGDVVASADHSVVVVEEIRSDEIVVVFEGYRMLLNLADHSK